MLKHTKRQVDMIKMNMFIYTAVCILFLIHEPCLGIVQKTLAFNE